MNLKDLTLVEILIDAKISSCHGSAGASESIRAKGVLKERQPIFSKTLKFDSLTYCTHSCYSMGMETERSPITLSNVSVNKKYIIMIGKPQDS